jgi:hypothetical protein
MAKKKHQREYIHCMKCLAALENPVYRTVDTETFYVDFAVCEECRVNLLSQGEPIIVLSLEGEGLKALLKSAKKDTGYRSYENHHTGVDSESQ